MTSRAFQLLFSIYPQLQNGQAVAEVTLLQRTVLKKVTEKLD